MPLLLPLPLPPPPPSLYDCIESSSMHIDQTNSKMVDAFHPIGRATLRVYPQVKQPQGGILRARPDRRLYFRQSIFGVILVAPRRHGHLFTLRPTRVIFQCVEYNLSCHNVESHHPFCPTMSMRIRTQSWLRPALSRCSSSGRAPPRPIDDSTSALDCEFPMYSNTCQVIPPRQNASFSKTPTSRWRTPSTVCRRSSHQYPIQHPCSKYGTVQEVITAFVAYPLTI